MSSEKTTEEFLCDMYNFFNKINEVKRNVANEIAIKEAEQEDLLHEIELSKLNAPESAKMMKHLKKIRKERRKYKDELVRINTLKGFADKYNNKSIVNDLERVIENLKTLEANNQTRIYKPKVLKKLKCGGTNENRI